MYIDEIPDNAKQIPNSIDYIDTDGNVYGYDTRTGRGNRPFIKTQRSVHGYRYVGVRYVNPDGTHRVITKRVHKLVALCFIPNPDNLPIVMHIDNNKSNNNVSNLRWGTASENTKQAVNDGLLVNDKGWDDSQSIPCDCYDTCTNELVATYGSISEAERATGINVGTIRLQIASNAPTRKRLYFTAFGEGAREHTIIIQYDFATDREIARFPNCGTASRETGIPEQSISNQAAKKEKVKWSASGTYFKRVLLKCEETIESK